MSNVILFLEPESEIFSETRPNRSWLTKIRKLFHMTSRKETVQGDCFMDERQPNSLGHEDRMEWQRRKTRLQWLMWLSTQGIGKVIRASSYISIRRVVYLVPEACSTAMTEDRHHELAEIDLSMIAVALTPSWFTFFLLPYVRKLAI